MKNMNMNMTAGDGDDAEANTDMNTDVNKRILDRYFEYEPYFISSHHLHSYNDFVRRQMHQIIGGMNNGFAIVDKKKDGGGDGPRHSVFVEVGGGEGGKQDSIASGIFLDKPTLVDPDSGAARYMFPNEARLRGLTYASNIYCDVRLTFYTDGVLMGERTFPRHRIGHIPIMLHSDLCELAFRSDAVRREMGECPYDQGGYFIIGGGEKVVMAQELPVYNRLFVTAGKDPTDVQYEARVRCIDEHAESLFTKTVQFRVYANDKTRVRNAISVRFQGMDAGTQLPLFLLFRVLGMESDKDIIESVLRGVRSDGGDGGESGDRGGEEAMKAILRSCAIAAASTGTFDQLGAAQVLSKYGKALRPVQRLRQALVKDLFPNAGPDFRDKARYLTYIVGRLLRVATGVDRTTDRDTYEHKRVMVSGKRMAFLFRDQYRIFRKEAMSRLDYEFNTGAWRRSGAGGKGELYNLVNDANLRRIFDASLIDDGVSAAFRGAWNVDKTAAPGKQNEFKEEGVVQELARISYLAYMSHIRRVSGGDGTDGLRSPHFLYATQWGVICPVESPDGLGIGITKHLSMLCNVTGGVDVTPLLRHLQDVGLLLLENAPSALSVSDSESETTITRGDGHEQKQKQHSQSQSQSHSQRVIANDIIRGNTVRPAELERYVLALRRAGLVHPHLSVGWNVMAQEVILRTDNGRCTRPLLIVDHDTPVEIPGGTERPGVLRLQRLRRRLRQRQQGSGALPPWDVLLLGTLLTPEQRRMVMPGTTGFTDAVLAPWAESERHLARSADDVVTTTERLSEYGGCLEFVDVEEANMRLVAVSDADLHTRPCQRYTHREIHCTTILSQPANCIPFMDRNNSPRNVLCMAQSKQSIGLSVSNQDNRLDTMAAYLHYPQKPVVTTTFANRLMGGNLAFGENLIVAVASFTGYNQEDAVILNRDSVARGAFSITYMHTLKFEETLDGAERVMFANPLLDDDVVMKGDGDGDGRGDDGEAARLRERYATLDADGLPKRGARVKEGDALLGMIRITNDVKQERDAIGLLRVTDTQHKSDRTAIADRTARGTVDRVVRTRLGESLNSEARCKVRMRHVREPELGDKFASRHGQKGVVGMLIPALDMPFSSAAGITPDIIINPHAFPSRRCVGHLLECLLSKACVLSGTRVACDNFDDLDVTALTEKVLERGHGLERHGDELMYNGRTGEQMATKVFMGPTYYMRLKHMIADKINHRSTGPRAAITHQPTKGRNKHGGMRVGEMEHQALLSHGAAAFLTEAFMDRSDGHHMDVDADSGVPASFSKKEREKTEKTGFQKQQFIRRVSTHDPFGVDVRRIKVPYAFKLMHQETNAMALDMRLVLDDGDGGDGVAAVSPDHTPPPHFQQPHLHTLVHDLVEMDCDPNASLADGETADGEAADAFLE